MKFAEFDVIRIFYLPLFTEGSNLSQSTGR